MPKTYPPPYAVGYQNAFPVTYGVGGYDQPSGPTFDLFEYDSNTYYWDFETDITKTSGADVRVDDNGDDSLSRSPEVIVGSEAQSFVQDTKGYQPLVDGMTGINFNDDTDRSMEIRNPTITNGSGGLYVACNAYKSAEGIYILSITRNISSTNSRCQLQIAGNNQFGMWGAENDGGSPGWLAYGKTLTNGQWYTLEMQLIADGATASPVTLWVDGSEITYTFRKTDTFAQYPSTNPAYMILGNDFNRNFSYNGGLQKMVIQDGVPSASIRQSVSDYLVSVKPT